jgi:hypothetical protein
VKIDLAEREAELLQILREHAPSTVTGVQVHDARKRGDKT